MNERRWSAAEIRAEADRLTVIADHDPAVADPVALGAVGYLLLDILDNTHPDFDARLEQAIRLLRHGVEFAPADPLAHAWRTSLSVAYAHRASVGDGAEWEEALGWAEAAVATAGNPDEHAEAVLELANTHVTRLESGWDDENSSDAERIAELDKVSAILRGFDGTLGDAVDQACLDLQSARLLAARFEVLAEQADLDRALALFDTALPLLPPGHPDLPAGWSLLAELRHSQYLRSEDEAHLEAGVAAAVRAVESTEYADPVRPDRHLLLARLLLTRNDLRESPDPDDRDRLIDSLSVAVTGDVGAYTWYVLGDELLDRGRENQDAADLRAAAHWLRCYAQQQDSSGEDAWLAWSLLTEAHSRLFEITGEPEHADLTVECATRTLGFPMPRHDLVEEMHWRRLVTVFQDGDRPDLAAYVAEHPVLDWLRAAQRTVEEGRDGEATETTELLAFTVGLSWFRMMMVAPNQVVVYPADLFELLETMEPLFRSAVEISDLEDDLVLLLDTMGEIVANMRRVLDRDGTADFTNLQRVLAHPELGEERHDLIAAVAMLLFMAGSVSGSIRALDAGIDLLGRVEQRATDAEKRREAEALACVFRVFRAFNLRVKPARLFVLGRRAWELLAELPHSPGIAPVLLMFDVFMRPLTRMAGAEPLPPLHPVVAEEAWMRHLLEPFTVSEDLLNATARNDAAGVRAICDRLDRLAEASVDRDVTMAVHGMRAAALDQLSKMEPGNRDVLDKTIDAYTRAVELPAEGSPVLEDPLFSLAEALRRRRGPGDLARSREIGIEIVTNAGWRVLLQSGSAEAVEVARTAVPAVQELVAWCLSDGATADLVRTLDSRRSLVLRAANTTRSVAARLIALGHADLAEEWETAGGVEEALLPEHGGPGTGWGVLRRKVLTALTKDPDGLVTPPTIEELQKTLRTQGSDVLAYLVPANGRHEAVAVMIPARGEPVVRMLPDLGMGIPVERYQAAYDAWDNAADRKGPEYDTWRHTLRSVCEWAWRAVAGNLLEFGRRHAGDRDPRIVLVPIGILGLVPWHAAWRPIGGRDRYLVQDATISYAPSGRLFCEAVERPEILSHNAVLVGNPGRNLLAGAVEAKAIRDACYEQGVFLGGTGQAPRRWTPSPDGRGTPEEILERLRSPLRVLHLACHAVANVREPLRSSIELAGAPRSDLSAAELLELSPTRPLELSVVVLAGCTTHVTGVDYDEALSLSTTFLAIGARTVVGSLWLVPAGWATAHMMFLFHHNLCHQRLPPAEALRKAQIGMLESEPRALRSMPEELKELRRSDAGEFAIEHWAGFTHQGC
ncbi:CHAT domain-containing protein [Amycolatopsis australiensis]|uniref:CHAT domain-containing protein n=1 Tax=Amycolatopsis australiensis TaxID=546364 RepID=A0A1K1T684_9PSEU|nr:CHAT domain-containing protein [Amycolatopsis australiensis]SFW92107.1 CHAT domain-containing protein [Amycolatopsis australiensis]